MMQTRIESSPQKSNPFTLGEKITGSNPEMEIEITEVDRRGSVIARISKLGDEARQSKLAEGQELSFENFAPDNPALLWIASGPATSRGLIMIGIEDGGKDLSIGWLGP